MDNARRIPTIGEKTFVGPGVCPTEMPDNDNKAELTDNDYEKSHVPPLMELFRTKIRLPSSLRWISDNWTWTKLKPAIRCAITGWVAAVIFVIPKMEQVLGQASFLLPLAAFLCPAPEPFLVVFEREILISFFVTLAYAWFCLGAFLADKARVMHNPSATIFEIASGQYVEAGPSIVLGVFIFIGSVFFLYINVRQGPGPYLFACLYACLCIDVALTTAAIFPYPYYLVGQWILVPILLNAALSIFASVLIFPSTISAEYTARLEGVLTPMIEALELHRNILKTSRNSPDFVPKAAAIAMVVNQSEAALGPCAASARLLPNDLIYSRFAPEDFLAFEPIFRRIVGRMNGMGMHFTLIDITTPEKISVTPMPSKRNTPTPGTPVSFSLTHNHSMDHIRGQNPQNTGSNGSTRSSIDGGLSGSSTNMIEKFDHRPSTKAHSLRKHMPFGLHLERPSNASLQHRHPHQHNLLHHPLHLSKTKAHRREHEVGVFESQRYMDLEATQFGEPNVEEHTYRAMNLLNESCDELLGNCKICLTSIRDWIGGVRSGSAQSWGDRKGSCKESDEKIECLQSLQDTLRLALENFRNDKRHLILEPYRPAFEKMMDSDVEQEAPPHRYLFNCYVYQYHLMRLADILVSSLNEVIKMEQDRRRYKIWAPVAKIFRWSRRQVTDYTEVNEDEDPDIIQGMHISSHDLGVAKRRDPDALPAANTFEWLMSLLYFGIKNLGEANILFAINGGLLTVALCLPSLIKTSAPFAFKNNFSWGIFFGQLTLTRFRGDTTYGFISRVIFTFSGGVVGAIMWYISCASDPDHASAIGLAAVCGVCFPFFFYARLYWPIHPVSNIIFFTTATLVFGYSYQDHILLSPGSPGFGYTVAWRRFVIVTAGVFAAFLVSFLPPSTTLRKYQRRLLSTTTAELGTMYCAVISYGNSREDWTSQEILSSLLALRSKLNLSAFLRANVVYEFSLRGRWPAARYQKIMELELQISQSLYQLISVMEHLEPAWTLAFLKRTRFTDPDFQGDVLAVFCMIASSIRSGKPLPQITPTPLLDRFMHKDQGLDVIRQEAEDDFGLPRTLTLETLKNEQYMIFCVGVSTAFGIINRLDKLMFAAKEIVGEHYHIHGVGHTLLAPIREGRLKDYSSTEFIPPKIVEV